MRKLDYSQLSNTELIPLLDLPPDLDGLRYYIPKAEKIELLNGATPERTDTILADARARRSEHHANLSARRQRGPIDRDRAIEVVFSGNAWEYVEQRRPNGGFRDACTQRKASIAYVLRNVANGKTVLVTRATVEQVHQQLGLVRNWPPPRGRRRSTNGREAQAAGVVTAASLQ